MEKTGNKKTSIGNSLMKPAAVVGSLVTIILSPFESPYHGINRGINTADVGPGGRVSRAALRAPFNDTSGRPSAVHPFDYPRIDGYFNYVEATALGGVTGTALPLRPMRGVLARGQGGGFHFLAPPMGATTSHRLCRWRLTVAIWGMTRE